MAYLGNDLQVAYQSYKIIDDISSSFNSSLTSFPLQIGGVAPVPFPINPQQCLISVNGVVQEPDPTGTSGFNLVGSNIVFASAPTGGHTFFGVILAGADYINVGVNYPSGSASAPSITFDTDLDTGIYNPAPNELAITTNSTKRFNINSSGQVEISSAGSNAAPALFFNTDTNTGLYSPGADQLAISTGGTGRLFVDSSGRVGIGTTTPQSELTVRGSTPRLTLEPTADTQNCRIEFALTDGTVQSRITGGGSQGSEIRFSQGPTERLRITSDGKLLVGTSSASGSAILQVAGDISATGTAIISGLTYPTSDGEADQVLKTNGSGTLSFGSALPAGTVIYYAASTAPTGYLKANGDVIPNGSGTVQGVTADFSALYAVIGSTYGSAGQLPDLRGEFIRGWDDGKGVDPGRTLGSTQTDQNKQHNHGVDDPGHGHDINGYGIDDGSNRSPTGIIQDDDRTSFRQPSDDADAIQSNTTGITISNDGGTESRPRNIALLACIKY